MGRKEDKVDNNNQFLIIMIPVGALFVFIVCCFFVLIIKMFCAAFSKDDGDSLYGQARICEQYFSDGDKRMYFLDVLKQLESTGYFNRFKDITNHEKACIAVWITNEMTFCNLSKQFLGETPRFIETCDYVGVHINSELGTPKERERVLITFYGVRR
jgi:hypothetical protein